MTTSNSLNDTWIYQTPEEFAKQLNAKFDAKKPIQVMPYEQQVAKAQADLAAYQFKTTQEKWVESDYEVDEEEEQEIILDFTLPSNLSGKVSGSAIHSMVMSFLTSLSKHTLYKRTYKVFLVVSGRHRGTLGIMKQNLGTWMMLDIFDRIQIGRFPVPTLGDWDHDHFDVPVAVAFDADRIKVAKCQTIPITYSVVTPS